MLFPGDRTLNRAYEYIQNIYPPAEKMADDYLRSIGVEVNREPIKPSDLVDLDDEEQAEVPKDLGMSGKINFFN